MPLKSDYVGQECSLARSLEIVGERWTLLVIRDAFWGVRRFTDFVDHLNIPRAALTSRLKALTAAGVLQRVAGDRHVEYELTEKGIALWPVIRSLMSWGDDFYSRCGPRRLFAHVTDDGEIDRFGRCAKCAILVPAREILVVPGPGLESPGDDSWVTAALARPHRLLEPLTKQATGDPGLG